MIGTLGRRYLHRSFRPARRIWPARRQFTATVVLPDTALAGADGNDVLHPLGWSTSVIPAHVSHAR